MTSISSIDKELKTFRENRVTVIRKNIDIRKWFYVKSSDNPADIITRFNHYSLKENSLWLKGPGFLYLRENPNEEEISINENDGNVYLVKLRGDFPDVISKYYFEELHVTSSNVSLVFKGERLNEVICITHSKLNKLLRVASYVMRFINNLKRKV